MTQTAILIPYLIYCVLMTGTPGPNNAMTLAAGVRVGYWRSTPMIAGIAVGVGLQLVAIGAGLGVAFVAFPALHVALRFGGAAYLLWLAWKIARSGPIHADGNDRPPLGFFGAVAFQWINPKAWMITTSAVAAYVPALDYPTNVAIAASVLVLVALPCVSVWALGGSALRRFLMQPRYASVFNIVVALLLVATTVPILFGD